MSAPAIGLDSAVDGAIASVEEMLGQYTEESRSYWRFHRERWRWTLRRLKETLIDRPGDFELLDVGHSFQTMLLERVFPEARLSTLGYSDARYPVRNLSRHYDYDLNRAHDHESWPRPETPFDLITFLEVIEHLHVSPAHILKQFHAYLRPGGRLVISTPNAVSIHHRRSMLRGRNPYHPIRENHHLDPGHIREYTRAELENYADTAGFEVEWIELHDPYALSRLYRWPPYRLARRLFPSLRDSITTVLRKP